MGLSISLPAPRVVTQEPARCWQAAYASWSEACTQHLGLPVGPDPERMGDYLSSARLLTRAGRATDAGVRLLAGASVMAFREHRGNRVTPRLLAEQLANGYIWCAYYWYVGRRRVQLGHAVVIYGVTDQSIQFMDPNPNRGLVSVAASFFAKQSDRVVLGVSGLNMLASALGAATASLR